MNIDIHQLSAFAQSKDFDMGRAFIQKLFASRFITRGYNDESRRLYDFAENNQNVLNTILAFCGYKLVIHKGQQVVSFQSEEKTNRQLFTKDETIVYLRLLQRYKKSMLNLTNTGRKEAEVELSELLLDINILRSSTGKKPMLFKELQAILTSFYKMQMIRLNKNTGETIRTITEQSSVFVLSSINCLQSIDDINGIEQLIAKLCPPQEETHTEDDSQEGDDED